MLRPMLLIAGLIAAAPALAQNVGAVQEPQPRSGLDAVLAERAERRQTRSQAPGSEPGSIAVLRGLDKVTARTRDFEAPVGETVEFGALGITVQYCRKRPPEEPPEVFAFVQVDDRRTDGFGVETEGQRIFSGWMFASNPALNPLEHPVYDFWVIDCRS
ncbi:MAG: DUF2155 domain-containing protein [Oceanicaulis sp.]